MGLDYRKDIDGVHPINAGLLAQGRAAFAPNTPAGGMELLRRYGVELRGRRAAVVGRSAIVGRPMAQLLTLADAIPFGKKPSSLLVLLDTRAPAAAAPAAITRSVATAFSYNQSWHEIDASALRRLGH